MTRRRPSAGLPAAGVLAVGLLAACSGAASETAGVARPAAGEQTSTESRRSEPAARAAGPSPRVSESPTRITPEPRRSLLSIPALGLRSVPVVRYRGSPDDAIGTRIQNAGPAASPRGPGGGVGPGEVGNFIVTGHRTSHAAPFADLPALRVGDRVRVRSGGAVLVYRITATRSTSFRSPRSLAAQSAPVPGRPGVDPVRPMITLSTCATPEDHAAGNYWSDRFGNPEHRIDKVGVLVGGSG